MGRRLERLRPHVAPCANADLARPSLHHQITPPPPRTEGRPHPGQRPCRTKGVGKAHGPETGPESCRTVVVNAKGAAALTLIRPPVSASNDTDVGSDARSAVPGSRQNIPHPKMHPSDRPHGLPRVRDSYKLPVPCALEKEKHPTLPGFRRNLAAASPPCRNRSGKDMVNCRLFFRYFAQNASGWPGQLDLCFRLGNIPAAPPMAAIMPNFCHARRDAVADSAPIPRSGPDF